MPAGRSSRHEPPDSSQPGGRASFGRPQRARIGPHRHVPPVRDARAEPGYDPGTPGQRREGGSDHVCCSDHVSFAGTGFDGLVQATALAMLHATLPVYCGVYLLPLRHPVPVARQLADIARLAPGRLIFGTGIGGEERHEITICGVNPATTRQSPSTARSSIFTRRSSPPLQPSLYPLS
jgi:Luciferase-like monooxygenase